MKDKLARATWSFKGHGALSDVDTKQNNSIQNGTRRPLTPHSKIVLGSKFSSRFLLKILARVLTRDTLFFFHMRNSKFWPKNGRSVPDRETRFWNAILAQILERVLARDTSGHGHLRWRRIATRDSMNRAECHLERLLFMILITAPVGVEAASHVFAALAIEAAPPVTGKR